MSVSKYTSATAATAIANHWLLPDGVADLLSDDARKQEVLRYQLTQILMAHGYQLICPPMIEYTESLLNNATEDLKRQTFKIIDQLTGRLMGIRADITPQIARIDAHVCQAEGIARYCYAGHVIHTLAQGLFGSRTPLQLGAEIFGCDDIAADTELLELMFELFASLNLQNIHIDLGHIGVFAAICEQANIHPEQASKLAQLYVKKALPELKAFCQTLPMGEDFYVLGAYGQDIEQMSSQLSNDITQNNHFKQALADLTQLKTHLIHHSQADVSIDVTDLRGYFYHTGLVFSVYVGNETLPIAKGGRFEINQTDTKRHNRPAIGFSCDLSRLLNHVSLAERNHIIAPSCDTKLTDIQAKSLKHAISELRQQGQVVTIPLNVQDKPHASHQLVWQNEAWQCKKLT